MADKVLKRTMFETSRVLEYFTERELSYQTGHNKSDWPLVIFKELIDNARTATKRLTKIRSTSWACQSNIDKGGGPCKGKSE